MRVLVLHFINTTTFAARDFWPRRGASDAHTRQGSVRSEQRSLGPKEPLSEGCVAFRLWLRCSSVTAPLRGMLPRRASPEPKIDATNVVVFMKWSTELDSGSWAFTLTSMSVPRQNRPREDLGRWDSRYRRYPPRRKPAHQWCRNTRRTVRANQPPSNRAARSHTNPTPEGLGQALPIRGRPSCCG